MYLLPVACVPQIPLFFPTCGKKVGKALGNGAALQEKALPKAGGSHAGKLSAHQAEAGQMEAQLVKLSPKPHSVCSGSSCVGLGVLMTLEATYDVTFTPSLMVQCEEQHEVMLWSYENDERSLGGPGSGPISLSKSGTVLRAWSLWAGGSLGALGASSEQDACLSQQVSGAGQDGAVEPAAAARHAVPGAAPPALQRQLPHGAAAVPGPVDREPGLVRASRSAVAGLEELCRFPSAPGVAGFVPEFCAGLCVWCQTLDCEKGELQSGDVPTQG